MRKLLFAAVLALASATQAWAQEPYEITVTPTLAGGDSLILDIGIRSLGASFFLGNANVVIDLPNTTVDPPSVQPLDVTSWYWQPNVTYTNVSVSGALVNRIQVSVVISGNLSLQQAVDGTVRRLARVYVPIINCAAGTVDPQVSFSPVPTEVRNTGNVPQTFSAEVTPSISLNPPPITGTNNLVICSANEVRNYTTGVAGYWRIASNVGSQIISSPTNVNNVNVQFGVPAGTQRDTLYFSLTPGGVCESQRVIVLQGPPLATIPLFPVGSADVCVDDPRISLFLPFTEATVSYQLLLDGSPIGTPQIGTGAGLLFTDVPVPAFADSSFQFTYRATKPGCSTQQLPPGVVANVLTCTLPVAIDGAPSTTSCTNQDFELRVLSPDPTNSYTWTVINRAVGPRTTFPSGFVGDTVTAFLQPVVATQFDTVIVTRSDGFISGRDTLVVQLLPSAIPQISGPTFLLKPGAVVNGTYTVSNLTPGSTYNWSVTPTMTSTASGAQNETFDIQFTLNRTYIVRVTETNASGCVGTAEITVLVSACNSNPGNAGAAQVICQGSPTAVFVDETYAPQDSSRWEFSFNDTSGGSFMSVVFLGGTGRRGQVYFTPPLTSIGTYYFRLAAFCGATANYSSLIPVQVVLQPFPGAVTPTDTSVCENGQITLRLNGGFGQVQWQQSADGIFWTQAIGTTASTDSLRTSPLNTSTFFRANTTNGCDTEASNSVFVSVLPNPQGQLVTTVLDSVCVGSSTPPLQANIVEGEFGFWTSDGTGSFTPGPNPQYVTGPGDGGNIVTLSWIVTSGSCSPDIQLLSLRVVADPAATIDPLPVSSICAGGSIDSVRATILVGASGVWDDSGAGGTFLPSALSPTAQYVSNPASAGGTVTLRWITFNAPCVADTQSRSITIQSTQIGGAFPAPASEICFGDTTAPLGASVTFGTGRWVTTSTEGIFLPDRFDPNARFLPGASDASTTVTLTWQITNGTCSPLSISHPVFVRRLPRAVIFTPNSAICVDDSLSLNALASAGTGTWTATEQGTGIPAAGTFSNVNSPTARFRPAPADANKVFDFLWRVDSPGLACGTDQSQIEVQISGLPFGTFSLPPATEICAGASTNPLGATLGNALFTGVWRTPDGAGTFSDSLNPNGFYNSELADANQTITLQWVVQSAGCGEIIYEDTINVDNSVVEGTFVFQGSGVFDIRDSLCFVDSSRVLDAIALGTGVGVFRTPNGSGQFIDRTSGLVDTLNASGNVVYVPSASDRGTVVELRWVVVNPASPTCGTREIVRFLDVRDTIDGDFTPIPNVCFPFPSDTLRATLTGDPLARGRWQAVGASGASAFAPSDTARNVRFLPALADVGRTIEFQWIVSNNVCPSDTTRQFVFVGGEDLITVTTSDPDSTICFGDTTDLYVTGGDFYVWSPANEVDNFQAATVRAFPTANRLFQVRTFIGNCSFTKSIELTVLPGTPIGATASLPAICEGQATTLLPTGNVETGPTAFYRWRVVTGDVNSLGIENGGPDAEQPNPVVQPTFDTIYELFARSTNGCFSTAQVLISVSPNTPPSLLPSFQFCENNTAGLDTFSFSPTSSTCDTVRWYYGTVAELTALGFPVDSLVPVPQANPSDSTLVDVFANPGLRNYTIQCVNILPANCVTESDVAIRMQPSPEASFGSRPAASGLPFNADPNQPIVVPAYRPTVEFQDVSTGNPVLYFWNFGDPASGVANEDSTSAPSHRYSGPGEYTVVMQVENNLDCVDIEVRTNYVIVEETQYFFPTAFTPNGDGLNDVFRPLPNTEDVATLADTSANPSLLELVIFDRWGNVIYKALDPDQDTPDTLWRVGWSGSTADGTSFDVGTYTYTAKIRIPGRGIVNYRGFVSLIR